MRESPRLRRLRSDHQALEQLASESTIFSFFAHGDPPELYVLRFAGKGAWRTDDGEVRVHEAHEVHIRLGASYPRMMPELAWKSPIFHPNISASGVVCLGGYGTYWVPSLTLDELCTMLWDMIRYENYDETSPYNREAAAWVKHQDRVHLPLDGRPLRDRIAGGKAPHAKPPVAKAKEKTATGNRLRPAPSATPVPARAAPPARPASPAEAPVDAEVIFLDDSPSLRSAAPPAQSREDNGVLFIE
jgi:ubiquitin-protein ligase